jgi:Zn-dependent metalloprotease
MEKKIPLKIRVILPIKSVMKKWIIITVSLCFSFLSCKKEGSENSDCVNIIINSPAITILSESEMNVIKYLFNHNQLDYTKYQFTKFQEDDLGHRHVRCYQFANSLIVFTSDAIFHFDKNDNYYYLSGDLIKTINLNTKPSMKQDDVIRKYIDTVKHDEDFLMWLNLLVEMAKVDETVEVITLEDVIEGCFDVEFGYYDLNAGMSYTNENFAKSWKIKPTNSEYPCAYINDENSEIIYYDNGLRR